jgi:tetratricopeptide (TPR) repeat protein
MVLGAVTELNQKAGGVVIPLGGIGIGSGSHEAKARIEMRVIDVATSEIRLALTEVGTSKNSAQALSFGGISWAEGEFGGLEARAINDAAIRLANKIRVELGGEYSYVISGSGSEFIIDQGEANGVENGALFLVYAEGAAVRGMNGEVLGRDKIPLSVLKVKNAESAHSVCTVAPPTKGNLITRGDKVEPISAEEARTIKPVSSRPATSASSETFAQIFNEDAKPSSTASPGGASVEAETPEKPAEPQPGAATAPRQPAGSYPMREIEGVDPNNTTDAKLIEAYSFIEPAKRNTLGIQHRGALQMYSGKRYKDAFEIFTKLTDDNPGNYLSAYWAGMCAIKLGSGKEAAKWFDQALAFNPDYQPAIDAKATIGEEPANKPAKKKK